MKISNIWYKRYINLAKEISTWSKDPGTKVGAIIVGSKGQILSQGYNGFPRGILDTKERLNNREIKLSLVVHAEMNAIYNASYSGICLNGSSIFIYGLPVCNECAKGIIQVGIKKVIVLKECIIKKKQWQESWNKSINMFKEAGIKIIIL